MSILLMALKARPPLKTHSLFPNSPSNRLLCMEYKCSCLHFIFIPSLTPAQTYAMPPVITLEICPSLALSTHIDYQGNIEYRKGFSNPKGGQGVHAAATSWFRMDPYSRDRHCAVHNEIQVYVCWSVNWEGPIPLYPGLPPGNHNDLHFPSAFILDGSHGKWDCRVLQCWDNSRPWAPLIPSKNCPCYQNHLGLQSLVDVAIEACNNEVSSKHDHPVNTPGLFVLPSLLFTINLFNSICDAEINLFKEARGHPFVMWLRSYMYPIPDGTHDEEWLKEQEFCHIEEVFGWLGIAQGYVQWATKPIHERSNFSCEPDCGSRNRGKPVGICGNKDRYLVLCCAKYQAFIFVYWFYIDFRVRASWWISFVAHLWNQPYTYISHD